MNYEDQRELMLKQAEKDLEQNKDNINWSEWDSELWLENRYVTLCNENNIPLN